MAFLVPRSTMVVLPEQMVIISEAYPGGARATRV